MLVFVDYEHADRYGTDGGDRILAARTRITYRLEDLSGQHCMLVRYDSISPELLDRLGATAIFISGNGTDPSRYDPGMTAPLAEIVRSSSLPMFGFCGGFQFIASALGAAVTGLDVDDDQPESDTLSRMSDGRPFEFGYHPIDVHPIDVHPDTAGPTAHPLLEGWRTAPVFRHAHGLHVPDPPEGFTVLASTALTPVQLAVNDERQIVGTQFHPEYWTEEHPAGHTLIANFMQWADLTDR